MFIATAIELAANAGGPPLNNPVAAANHILCTYRPSQIADFLEEYWRSGVAAFPALNLGVPNAPPGPGGPIAQHVEEGRPNRIDVLPPVPGLAVPANVAQFGWHHLVYAYMVENTRILDVFRRVVFEYVQGERLPHATHETVRWLRTTEELFFTTPRAFSVRGVTSNMRPDDGAVRRNLYQRMLGMDLNHGTEDGRPYPYSSAQIANREFVALWETLLTEVWKAHTASAGAFSGVDETDDAAIGTLVRRLQELLLARRLNGLLSREEFDAVACLSWFHLAIAANTQIVTNLSAQAAGEADRLKQIGAMVGLSAHSRSDAYLQLAAPMSIVLRDIENGAIPVAGPPSLYDPAVPVNWVAPMLQVLTHWSIATGRNMKDGLRRQATLPVLTETVNANQRTNGARLPSRIPAELLR